MAFQRASNDYIQVAVHQCCGLIQQVDNTTQPLTHSLYLFGMKLQNLEVTTGSGIWLNYPTHPTTTHNYPGPGVNLYVIFLSSCFALNKI